MDTIWTPDLSGFDGRPSQRLAAAIESAIDSGELDVGSQLPPHRSLAYALGVSVGAVSRAYAVAARKRLIGGEVGRGTFVLAQEARGFGASPATTPESVHTDLRRIMPAPVGQLVAFREIAANVARLGTEAQLLEYSPPGGDRRTRDAGAHWLRRRGLSTTSDRIIVTGGVHQGISTAILSATEPGDLIVAEKLTYRGLIDVARFLGRRLETIEMDDQGATPDALRALCKQKRPRLLFLTPAFQNPTTAFMGEERRCDLARIAADNDLLVIEDDIYANLSDEQPPAVRDIYPDGVFYLNGPTKSIAPGLRTAFLCAPEAWRVKATAVQQSQALGASAYLSAITAEFILSGQAEDFLTAQKAELAARYRIFEMELEGADFTGSPEAPHVWLRLPRPWRAHTFSAAAEDLGVATTPADEFAIGREPAPHAVRLAIGAPRKRHALEVALQKIAGLLDREPMAPSAV